MSNDQFHMSPIEFDSDLVLQDVLSKRLMMQIDQVIKQFGINQYLIMTLKQEPLSGELAINDVVHRMPLAPELEPIGFLCFGEEDTTLIKGIHRFVVMMVQSEWRYHMASDMHLKAIKADYEALKEKHELLQQSEQKYRELSESLELKVKEQVETIEAAQRKLYESEKLASVGQLAAGVAHEINNPIGFIYSNLKTAKEYIDEIGEWCGTLPAQFQSDSIKDLLEDFPFLLDESRTGAERIRQIVADLKAYSDIDYTEQHNVNIKEAVERVVRIFNTQHNKSINMTIDVPDSLNLVCHSGFINQLFLNILSNSANAIEQSGDISINANGEEHVINIVISDNGCGMNEEVIKRAFEPFYTTHDVGKGTGLGLTVARDIARNHNGDIELKSEPGTGTQVFITLGSSS